MKPDVRALAVNGAFTIAIEQHKDLRGRFFECWRSAPYSEQLRSCPFVQANLSCSPGSVVRGLHYQVRSPQAQLVTVVRGVVYDVMVDLRRSSDTFGRVVEVELDSETPMQVYMPPGVAHGFQVLSDEAILHYMCTRFDGFSVSASTRESSSVGVTETRVTDNRARPLPECARSAWGIRHMAGCLRCLVVDE